MYGKGHERRARHNSSRAGLRAVFLRCKAWCEFRATMADHAKNLSLFRIPRFVKFHQTRGSYLKLKHQKPNASARNFCMTKNSLTIKLRALVRQAITLFYWHISTSDVTREIFRNRRGIYFGATYPDAQPWPACLAGNARIPSVCFVPTKIGF